MNIFLTGGSGFIGSNFINHAIEEGHNIYAIIRKKSLPKLNLKKQPTWIEGDLNTDFSFYLPSRDRPPCSIHSPSLQIHFSIWHHGSKAMNLKN